MSPICPTHGVDHNDPAEMQKLQRKLRRRLHMYTALYLSAVALGFFGAHSVLGTGGLALAVSAFFIHFGNINMRLNGGALEEISTDIRQREHLSTLLDSNASVPMHSKGTYL